MARILIIDDNPEVLSTYGRILEHAGYEIVFAADGNEGIRVFREKSPDLVITDIVMPEKEGLETIGELKRDFPDVKIIAISGSGKLNSGYYLKAAKQIGAEYSLAKPIEREELLETVRECLI